MTQSIPAAMPSAARRVMVVGPDTDRCLTLCAIVEAAGYGAVACTGSELARKLLRIAPHPFVVLLTDGASGGGAEPGWERVLDEMEQLPAHVYLLLPHEPQKAPWRVNPYTHAFVPVVPMPIELDLLVARLAGAVAELPALSERYGPTRQ